MTGWRCFGRQARALRSARVLDAIVAGQLKIVARLPEDRREVAADHLAEFVLLA